MLHTCTHTCKVAWTLACVLPTCTEVARLTVACTRAACLPERSRRARRAGVHARCFGLASLECIMLTLLCYRYKPTSEMTTSEMTTSETSQTSEKKHEASGCACEPHELRAPRTANPRDQETESRTKNTQVPLTARVLTSFRQVPGVADLGARGREGDAGEEADLGARRGEGDTG